MTLIERLEAATGADRELDARVWCAMRGHYFHRRTDFEGAVVYMPRGGKGMARESDCPRYTADLNAALALVEEKLPGWTWSVDSARSPCAPTDDGRPQAKVQAPGGRPFGGGAPTPALAVLIALLKALGDQHD